jgi:hypothetical protein
MFRGSFKLKVIWLSFPFLHLFSIDESEESRTVHNYNLVRAFHFPIILTIYNHKHSPRSLPQCHIAKAGVTAYNSTHKHNEKER